MNVVFQNVKLEKIYRNGVETGKPVYGQEVVKSFIKKVDILLSITSSRELTKFQSLHFEKLKRELSGFYSIRVNVQYRIIFNIHKTKEGRETIEIAEIHDLKDYH